MVIFYTGAQKQMPAEKSLSVSFRVTAVFKELLEKAAAREQRSRTNLLENLLFDHCQRVGVLSARSMGTKTTKRGSR
jgi:uncharacterized protein (DUF1778 family)